MKIYDTKWTNPATGEVESDGTLSRLWFGWSNTTGRHIAAFCGLNKKEFINL